MSDARDKIPSPPGFPLIGNVLDIQNEVPTKGFEDLIDIYGPIIRLNLFGKELTAVANVSLVEEVCDETRFWKAQSENAADLKKNQETPNGLFVAPSEEDWDWQMAHRILMPAFGPLSIERMFDEMHDIASQLILKWARMGPSNRIPVTSDFTRLTLDTIALCCMDYRFNSFYQEELHPFVKSMTSILSASSDRLKIGSLLRKLIPWDRTAEKVQADGSYLVDVANELVQIRRDNPTTKRDLMNAMILGKDPKTGESMPTGVISQNMITFLIAGHETTSGLLSFAFLFLLKHPEAYFKAQEEVDRVIGQGNRMTVEHLKELRYINAVLRETIRLCPTVPQFTRSIRRDNSNDFEYLAGGQYAVSRNDKILCLVSKSQRDPKVYGEDANEFRPERMLDENFLRLPKAAWKPFGTGLRACIGRQFAWQEAQMCVALLLQNFNLRLDDPTYNMKIKQTLTVKPDGFYMKARLREGITATSLQASLSASDGAVGAAVTQGVQDQAELMDDGLKPLTVLYGSNTGTCQSLAQRLSTEAGRHGYKASVMEMNAAVGAVPKEQPLIVVTSSYEGQPPDNATQFLTYLETTGESLSGVEYSVFGCGHSDWVNTFQRIPEVVDNLMQKRGGKRLMRRGLTDVAKGNVFSDFDGWVELLWSAVAPNTTAAAPSDASMQIVMSEQDRTTFLRQDVKTAVVVETRRLTAEGEPEKHHLRIRLPHGMRYSTGDYLAVLPLNSHQSVSQVLQLFRLPGHCAMLIKPGAATFLPTDMNMPVAEVLQGFVELNQPATKKDVQMCASACQEAAERAALEAPNFFAEIVERRTSLVDLLTKYPSIDLDFGTFLSALPPLRPRHYSISSSPLADPSTCSITFGVVNEAAKSGVGRHIGVTSAYLSSLKPGDDVQVSVRATNKFFHLPSEPTTPVLMFGAGTGMAPFRGFVEERAIQIAAGRQLGQALMFMGCRSTTKDRLYADELDAWAQKGAVDVRYAFSRESEQSQDCKHLQDRMRKDKEDILRMWRDGAKVFICGSPAVSEQVQQVALQLLIETEAQRGQSLTLEKAQEWFRGRRNERYVVDVFA